MNNQSTEVNRYFALAPSACDKIKAKNRLGSLDYIQFIQYTRCWLHNQDIMNLDMT